MDFKITFFNDKTSEKTSKEVLMKIKNLTGNAILIASYAKVYITPSSSGLTRFDFRLKDELVEKITDKISCLECRDLHEYLIRKRAAYLCSDFFVDYLTSTPIEELFEFFCTTEKIMIEKLAEAADKLSAYGSILNNFSYLNGDMPGVI